jgi:hypothetical protein
LSFYFVCVDIISLLLLFCRVHIHNNSLPFPSMMHFTCLFDTLLPHSSMKHKGSNKTPGVDAIDALVKLSCLSMCSEGFFGMFMRLYVRVYVYTSPRAIACSLMLMHSCTGTTVLHLRFNDNLQLEGHKVQTTKNRLPFLP